jgi:hypothetical protein
VRSVRVGLGEIVLKSGKMPGTAHTRVSQRKPGAVRMTCYEE